MYFSWPGVDELPEGRVPTFEVAGHGEVQGMGETRTDDTGVVYLRCSGQYGNTWFDITLLEPTNMVGKRTLEDVK